MREIRFSARVFRQRNGDFICVEVGDLLEDVRPRLENGKKSKLFPETGSFVYASDCLLF